MKPTKEQIERYIQFATEGIGPSEADDYGRWCANILRTSIKIEKAFMFLTEDGIALDATFTTGGGGGGGGGNRGS